MWKKKGKTVEEKINWKGTHLGKMLGSQEWKLTGVSGSRPVSPCIDGGWTLGDGCLCLALSRAIIERGRFINSPKLTASGRFKKRRCQLSGGLWPVGNCQPSGDLSVQEVCDLGIYQVWNWQPLGDLSCWKLPVVRGFIVRNSRSLRDFIKNKPSADSLRQKLSDQGFNKSGTVSRQRI